MSLREIWAARPPQPYEGQAFPWLMKFGIVKDGIHKTRECYAAQAIKPYFGIDDGCPVEATERWRT